MASSPLSHVILNYIAGLEKDTIAVKRAYIEICDGDIVAALMLSQILYYHLPAKSGLTKLRVQKMGHLWLAKQYNDWWDECRIKSSLARKKIDFLVQQGILIKKVFKFNGLATVHVRINCKVFEDRIKNLSVLRPVVEESAPNPEKHKHKKNPSVQCEQSSTTKTGSKKRSKGYVCTGRSGLPPPDRPLTEITNSKTTDKERNKNAALAFLNSRATPLPEEGASDFPDECYYPHFDKAIERFDPVAGKLIGSLFPGYRWRFDPESARAFYRFRQNNALDNESVALIYLFWDDALPVNNNRGELRRPNTMKEFLTKLSEYYQVIASYAELALQGDEWEDVSSAIDRYRESSTPEP